MIWFASELHLRNLQHPCTLNRLRLPLSLTYPNPQKLGEADPTLELPTNMNVPWMHAHAHGPDCYLVNSGMYCQGMWGGCCGWVVQWGCSWWLGKVVGDLQGPTCKCVLCFWFHPHNP